MGIDADVGFGGFGGRTTTNCGAVCEATNTTFGTVRGTLGLASNVFHRFIPIVTAGIAYGNVRADIGPFESTNWHVGHVEGFGFDYVLTHGMFFELKYLHADLGNVPCGGVGCGSNTTVHFTDNIIGASINFQIGKFAGSKF